MIAVFDNSTISNVLNHYYEDIFKMFWTHLDELILMGEVVSVREVEGELYNKFKVDQVNRLSKNNKQFYLFPETHELSFITKIYSVKHFQQNLERKKLLKGGPFADPFLIAKAKVTGGCVVTEEKHHPNAAQIPNICEHFKVECTNLEGFLRKQDWKY